MKADLDWLWWTLGTVAAVVAATLGALALGESIMFPVLWMALPVVVWLLVRKMFNTPYLSPTTIVAGIFMGIAVFGFLLRDVIGKLGTRGASVALDLTEDQALQTLRLISVAATLVVVSSALMIRMFGPRKDALRTEIDEPKAAKTLDPGPILLLSALPLVGTVASIGLSDIIERDYYVLGERGSLLGSVGALIATAAVLVVGYAFGASKGGGRFVSIILLVGYTTLLLSYGSRRLAMIPILFAVGVFIAKNTRATRRGIAFAGALSFFLLPLPLEFRNNATHGIVPYMETFSQFTFADVDWIGALNNILVAFPIIGESAYGPKPVYLSDILISLNPVPGSDAGWYEIYPRMRLNFFTPMSGIGELGHVGWSAVVPFFLILGVVLAWLELLARQQMRKGSPIYVGVVVAVSALFALQMVQYNLRSATRFLVYLAVAEFARQAWLVVARTGKVKPRHTPLERQLAAQLAAQARKADSSRA